MSEPSAKRYNKKHTINLINTNAIMVDKAFNPKIAQLTINNNLPRIALFWVLSSRGHLLRGGSLTSNICQWTMCLLYVSASTWPSSGRCLTNGYNDDDYC